MFKNSLFLKILFIFTLPIMGIFYFATSLVYNKIELSKEIDIVNDNLEYLKITETILSNLQKERDLSLKYYLSEKNRLELDKTRELTLNALNKFKVLEKRFYVENQLNNNKIDIVKLDNFRNKIDKFELSLEEIFIEYNNFNKIFLHSLYIINSLKSNVIFDSDFTNIINFLNLKESSYIEKSIINLYLSNNQIDETIYEIFLKNYSYQEINKEKFFSSVKSNAILKFNEKYSNEVFLLRNSIKNRANSKVDIKIDEWERISAENLEYLDDIYNNLINTINKSINKYTTQIMMERNESIIFLFLCFSLFIFLFFVLKNIILKEQKTFYRVQKHRDIYELLNKANKFLLKISDKKNLYSSLGELLTENENIQFCFIYDLIDGEITAQDGELKQIIASQISSYNDKEQNNVVSRTIKWESNIIINDFSKKNISVFHKDAKKLNINSMASFPIRCFNKVSAALVIYSKQFNFFDKEVEILFDKLISDITHCLEKIEYEEIRLNQEDELRLASYAFESSEPMLITNNVGEIVKVNQAFCSTMGYAKEEIIGRNPRIFKSIHQDKRFVEELWTNLKVQGSWSGEVYNKKANEDIIPLRITITAIKDNDGKITHFLGQYIDIGEQKDKEKVLEYQATHDNLTGLPNRLLILDRIEHAITKVVRHKIVGGLIFIDLDNFKEVNDTLGHDIGDALLIMVAKKIKEVIREEDTIARIGGDEFIVLIDNIGNNKLDAKVNITNLAEKIKDTLNAITHIEGHINVSTPSIGITLFNDASVSVKDIIKQADTAMYVAKKQGKNAIEFFD